MIATDYGSRCMNRDCPGWVKEKPSHTREAVTATSVSPIIFEASPFFLVDILLLLPPGDRLPLQDAAKTISLQAFVVLLEGLAILNGFKQSIETILQMVATVKQLVTFLTDCFFHSSDGVRSESSQATDAQVRRIRKIGAQLEAYSQQRRSYKALEDFIVKHGGELGLAEAIGKKKDTQEELIKQIMGHLKLSFNVLAIYDYPDITLIMHLAPVASAGLPELIEITCPYLGKVILDIDRVEDLLLSLLHFSLSEDQDRPNRILGILERPDGAQSSSHHGSLFAE